MSLFVYFGFVGSLAVRSGFVMSLVVYFGFVVGFGCLCVLACLLVLPSLLVVVACLDFVVNPGCFVMCFIMYVQPRVQREGQHFSLTVFGLFVFFVEVWFVVLVVVLQFISLLRFPCGCGGCSRVVQGPA